MGGYSRGRLALLLATSLGFVAIGVFMGRGAGDLFGRIMGWVCILFFGLGVVIFGWALIAPKSFQRFQERRGMAGGLSPAPFDPQTFAYPIVTVPGRQARTTWEALRAAGEAMLVIIGDDRDGGFHIRAMQVDGVDAAQTLDQAAGLAPDAFRSRWAAEEDEDPSLEGGEWPRAARPRDRALPIGAADPTNPAEPRARVHIALLPTRDPVAAPAFLAFGGWNATPSPAEHIAFLRPLADRYGAAIVSLTADTMELRLETLPQSREEALALARLIHAYSDWDVNSFAEIAADLMVSRRWIFWWD